MRQLNISTRTWPVAGEFRISRSRLTHIEVVQVHIRDGEHVGRGECRPYARYEETPGSVTQQIENIRNDIESGINTETLTSLMKAGAARNAVDCALWDLKAKMTGLPVWQQLGLPKPKPRKTALTLSLNTPDLMAKAAIEAKAYPVLKMKIGESDSLESVQAVMLARPDARLIIDANEALDLNSLEKMQADLKGQSVVFIEQPLPASYLGSFDPQKTPLICADEALHTPEDLPRLWDQGYRAVNVKLDKCGGLTEAFSLMQRSKEMGFVIMAGCMVSSSLAIAPMVMLESFADVIDLDGPLLLKDDVKPGLTYDGAILLPPRRDLWG